MYRPMLFPAADTELRDELRSMPRRPGVGRDVSLSLTLTRRQLCDRQNSLLSPALPRPQMWDCDDSFPLLGAEPAGAAGPEVNAG